MIVRLATQRSWQWSFGTPQLAQSSGSDFGQRRNRMEFETVFDLAQAGYKWWFPAYGLIFVGIGLS
jgi:hypothetical protein